MISEPTMEKKSPGRVVSVTPKGSSEVKTKQDAPYKNFRPHKQKEHQQYPRPEANKKQNNNNTQRWKNNYDRKPRNRLEVDSFGSEVAFAFENLDLDGNSQRSNKRVRNVNHYFNFTMNHSNSGGSPLDNAPSLRRTKLPKYNKEYFLLAKCQFVVNEGGTYSVNTKETDILVDWEQIEEMVMPTFEPINCPICLYPPVAAKLTRCGHIYCWPCILHYSSLSDKSWRKCPICYESIHIHDLKSVTTSSQTCFKIGDTLSMFLMKRPKHSKVAQPLAFYKPTNSIPLNMNDMDESRCFQKVLIANKNRVYAILEREKQELEVFKSENLDAPEVCFTDQALNLLKSREDLLSVHKFADKEAQNVLKETLNMQSVINSSANGLDLSFSYQESNEDTSTTESVNSKDFHYFYQSTDGQCIFLNPLNIQMLVAEFGSLDQCPLMITGKILDLESNFMNENLRKRHRYLGHLPLTSEYSLVELEVSDPAFSPETLKQFERDIRLRKKQRKEKARLERWQDKKNKVPVPPDMDSYQDFPTTLSSANDSLLGMSPPNSEEDFPSLSTASPLAASPVEKATTTSFAQIMKDEKIRKDDFPCLTGSTSFEFPTHTSGGAAGTSFAQVMKEGKTTSSWPDLRNLPEPPPSLGDCMSLAFDRLTETNGLEPSTSKKKKKKKTVLFSTGIKYSKN